MNNMDTPAISSEQALTVAGVAEMLHVSEDTVRRHARTGEIPGFKIGRDWRFFPSQVRERLEQPVDLWAQSRQSRGRSRVA